MDFNCVCFNQRTKSCTIAVTLVVLLSLRDLPHFILLEPSIVFVVEKFPRLRLMCVILYVAAAGSGK
jgi:hypothetical protein